MLEAPSAVFVPTSAGETSYPYLSLVIPAYNEERRLGPTLASVFQYFARRPYTSEVIVVSDGSADGTSRVAREAISRLAPDGNVAGLRVLPQSSCELYVPAWGTIRDHFVAFTDADLSTPVEEVDRPRSSEQ